MLDFTNYTTRHKNGDPHLEQCMSGLYVTEHQGSQLQLIEAPPF
jgi:hypothetical protein